MFPGRKSGFRAGFRPDSGVENLKIDPPAGRADFEVFPITIWPKSAPETRFTARKHHCITLGTLPRSALKKIETTALGLVTMLVLPVPGSMEVPPHRATQRGPNLI